MDFVKALDSLLTSFEDKGVRHALIGGVALGALGVPRATMDLDFLVHRDDLSRLHEIMTMLGYERAFHSTDVSQYRHKDAAWGAVDFLHAYRSISVAMLNRALSLSDKGSRTMRVLQPEDVIGLKVQAMANDPHRKDKEMADIKTLMGRYRARLDWSRLIEFFELFGFHNEIAALKKEFDHAQ